MPIHRVSSGVYAPRLIHQGTTHGYTSGVPNTSGYGGGIEASRIAQPSKTLKDKKLIHKIFPAPSELVGEVILEIIDLSTGQNLGSYPLSICVSQEFTLDTGNYNFKATRLSSNEVQEVEREIVEGTNDPLDIIFHWIRLQYYSEPPITVTFNKLKYVSEPPVPGAWNKLAYEGE